MQGAAYHESETFKILIVDDQERNLIALEAVLRDVPATIVRALSGERALALSLQHQFALAILDVQMPGMDGYELADLLCGQPSADPLPIIFVTAAYADEGHQLRGYATGAVDYLFKPIEPTILLSKVRVFLELARARHELRRHLNASHRKLATQSERIQLRMAFRRMLSKTTKQLFWQDPDHAHAGIHRVIEAVANYVHATCATASLFPHDTAPGERVSWHDPTTADACAVSATVICPRLLEPLSRGDLLPLQTFADLPDDDRARLEAAGLASVLLFPMIDADAGLVGVLEFGWAKDAAAGADLADLAEQMAMLPNMISASMERTVAERRRTDADGLQRFLFEMVTQGVIYHDREGTVTAANSAAAALVGLTPRDVVGRSVFDEAWGTVDELGNAMERESHPSTRALRLGHAVSSTVIGVTVERTGERRWLLADAVPVVHPGETEAYQISLVFTDLAAIREATEKQARLDRAEAENRAKSELLANVSHEIRTPLNACIGYTQLLMMEDGLSATQQEYLQAIDRAGTHLVTLVNNVLDTSKLAAGVATVDLVSTDLHDLLGSMEQMFRLRAKEKRLALTVEIDPTFPERARVDASKLRQILINLIGNAIKFTRRGSVAVRVSSVDGTKLRMEVVDTGIGLPEADVERIFEPFVQVSPALMRSGTGLGLAVTRRLARLMGGDVTVRPNDGRGSVFVCEIVAGAGAQPSSNAPRIRRGGGPRPVEAARVERPNTPDESPDTTLPRVSLDGIPAERVLALEDALNRGYVEQIRAEFAAVQRWLPPDVSASALELVDRFDFDALSELLFGGEVQR